MIPGTVRRLGLDWLALPIETRARLAVEMGLVKSFDSTVRDGVAIGDRDALEAARDAGRLYEVRVAVDRERNLSRAPGGGRAGAAPIRDRDAGEPRTPAPDSDPAPPDPGQETGDAACCL